MSQNRARLKDKKFCRDKEIYVAIEFRSSRKSQVVLQQSFYVATQDTYVVTKTRQLQQNYIAILPNYVTTEFKKRALKYVVIETAGHDKNWETKMRTMSR